MQYFSVPTCFFPTTTLFVDDSRDFLLNFVLQLDEGLSYKLFDSPFAALDYMKEQSSELDLLSKRCISEYTEAKHCPITNQTINLDLAAIHKEIYNSKRFSDVSVMVIDYAMPGMNGLEFCRLVKNPNIRKILLTGQADEHLAIEAFNEGLIDRYIKKSADNISSLIIKSIHDLQWQYFQSMSDLIVKMISVSSPSCLNDSKFADFFKEMVGSHGIVEYYLADNSGSFLMLDEAAKVSFLLVKNNEDMRSYYDLALDNGANEAVLDQLANKEKIPCFWQPSLLAPKWEEWSQYLVDAYHFKGKEDYYYAFVPGVKLLDIAEDKVISYQKFLDTEEMMFE